MLRFLFRGNSRRHRQTSSSDMSTPPQARQRNLSAPPILQLRSTGTAFNMDEFQVTNLFLLDLPTELVQRILEALDIHSLATCAQTCRFLHNLIASTASIQLKIELAANGLENGPPSSLTTYDRLRVLKGYQNAWENLEFTDDETVDMPNGRVWELYGGVLASSSGPCSLEFRQLPSRHRGIKESVWTIDDLGIIIRDFGMDPAQDLLIVIELVLQTQTAPGAPDFICRAHARSLRTGAPHPHARDSVLLSLPLQFGEDHSYAIQISEQYLGLMFDSSDSQEFLVCNWKTGEIKLFLEGNEMTSFAFLTERHVIIALVKRMPIRSQPPHLVVYDFEDASSERVAIADSQAVYSLQYPTMGSWTLPFKIEIRSDPAPQWTPDVNLRVPFHTAQSERLFVMTYWGTDGRRVHSFVLFVPLSTITTHLPGEKGRSVPWKAWGPHGTRMIPSPANSNTWVCFVYGQKFVALFGTAHQPVLVFDFNQRAIKRSLSGDKAVVEGESKIITQPTIIKRTTHGVFAEAVSTYLPYRLKTVSLLEDDAVTQAVMCSEDNIILVYEERRKYRILSL